jgi:branched-chain amino acid transport system ATP-binding protein
VLELEGFTCGYGLVQAVQNLKLSVRGGRITALLGPNGAGKSSTLLAIAGHVTRQAGLISFLGEDIASLSPAERTRRGIAIAPEGRRVFTDLSVAENLQVGGYTRTRAEARESEASVMSLFPRLRERYRQRAGSLSGGEQQMLSMGRALMARPRLLLVDELSLGLMPAMVDICFDVLHRLKEQGLGILVVEQNTHRALAAADEVIVLVSGRKAYQGSGEQARTDPTLINSFLGMKEVHA